MAGSTSSTDSASGSASSWSYALSMSVMTRAVFAMRRAKVAVGSARARAEVVQRPALRELRAGDGQVGHAAGLDGHDQAAVALALRVQGRAVGSAEAALAVQALASRAGARAAADPVRVEGGGRGEDHVRAVPLPAERGEQPAAAVKAPLHPAPALLVR